PEPERSDERVPSAGMTTDAVETPGPSPLTREAVMAAHPISEIARDIDFGPFLAAVDASARRSRVLLYLLIITLVASFARLQVDDADWMTGRVTKLQDIYTCWEGNYAAAGCEDYRKVMEQSDQARREGKRPMMPFPLPDRATLTDADLTKNEQVRQFRE